MAESLLMDDTRKAELRERAQFVYEQLVKAWGHRVWKARRDPMTELVSTMLSHRTTHEQEWAAMRQLWDTYGAWAAIAAAPVPDIEAAIHRATFPEVKAPRIKETLQIIGARTDGAYNLDFLADLPVDEGLAWLMSLPGVGIKTASLVLLFNFHKEIMPVDTHLHRVSGRIGLIGHKTSAEQAHHDLLELLPVDPDVYYNFHVSMLTHGRNICTWANPRCRECVVNSVCDYFRSKKSPRAV